MNELKWIIYVLVFVYVLQFCFVLIDEGVHLSIYARKKTDILKSLKKMIPFYYMRNILRFPCDVVKWYKKLE